MAEILELIEDGDLDAIKRAVSEDPKVLHEPDGSGFTPLMRAISWMERDFAIIEYFVRAGADVNAHTSEGYTPLHWNVDVGSHTAHGELPGKIARLLKEHGANVEAMNHYGWTPLMRAGLEGTDDEFKALLDIGARWDIVYDSTKSMPIFTRGRSLAHIILSHPEKMQMLIDSGFNPTPAFVTEAAKALAGAQAGGIYAQGVERTLIILRRSLPAS